MNKTRHSPFILYTLLSTLLGMLGCRTDVSQFRPYSASVADIRQSLAQVPDPATHSVFQLAGLDHDTILTTAGGVRVFLTDTEQLFQDEAGTPVPCSTCTNLTVEVTEVIRKGDMVARGLPTSTTNQQPMESVSIVQLVVRCDNKLLNLYLDRYIKVQVPSDELKPNLGLWSGVMAGDSLTGWSQAPNTAVAWADWPNGVGNTQTGYELITRQLGWLNAAALISDPTTQFCVSLPAGFDEENSQVFVLLKNNRSVFALSPGTHFGTFCLNSAPLGYPVQLITLTKLGDQFLLGNAQTEIGTNAVVNVQPLGTSEGEIIQFIKSL
jgi:hypothetical protein